MPSCHLHGWPPTALFYISPVLWSHTIGLKRTLGQFTQLCPIVANPTSLLMIPKSVSPSHLSPYKFISVQWFTGQRHLPDVCQVIIHATSPNITYPFPLALRSKHLRLLTLTPKQFKLLTWTPATALRPSSLAPASCSSSLSSTRV